GRRWATIAVGVNGVGRWFALLPARGTGQYRLARTHPSNGRQESMKIGLNGRFYGAPVSGVQRFAREAAARLFHRAGELVLFLPRGVTPPEGLDERVRVVHGVLRGRIWEHFELPWRARRERCDVVLNLANVAPLFGGPH